MKLMKHITIALVLCAIPAMAVGQTVSCDECSHVVSVYKGHGGLIATTEADMVTWVSTCEGVTRSGELMPNDDGVVSMLLSDDTGTSCYGDDEDNMFELGPVMDGGWYWITDATNSAVGGLINDNILMNDTTMLANAGEGVTMTMGKGAVLLKETATGRVGLLPNILPVMHVDPVEATRCSFTGTGATAAAQTMNCMLGNGGSGILVQGPTNPYTGKRAHLASGAMVTRPASGSVNVLVDLWGNGSGHYTAGTVDNTGTPPANPANLGHPGGKRLTATMAAMLASTGPGDGDEIDSTGPGSQAGAGLTFAAAESLGTLTIVHDASYCSATNNHTATINFTASLDATQKAQVVPALATTPAAAGVAARASIMVVCPSASANQGVELVPDNPFPVN